jgi:hypothetical protein
VGAPACRTPNVAPPLVGGEAIHHLYLTHTHIYIYIYIYINRNKKVYKEGTTQRKAKNKDRKKLVNRRRNNLHQID